LNAYKTPRRRGGQVTLDHTFQITNDRETVIGNLALLWLSPVPPLVKPRRQESPQIRSRLVGVIVSLPTPAQNQRQEISMLRRTFIALTTATAMATTAFAGGHSKDIVDTAVEAGSFTTLVAAVQAAGLVDTLKGDGPFTVFAPTDAAFAALPEGTVDALLADPDALAAILTYHVVPGKVMSGDLTDNMMAATANGAEVTIMTMGGVKVNDANVVTADVEASNGVIHVIDKVILPPS